MFYNVLIAISGVVALFGSWLAVQALVRRHSPGSGDEQDVLDCGLCGGGGSCHCGLRGPTSGDRKTGVNLDE